MASRAKADLKAAMADEVIADFDKLLESGVRRKHGAKAVRVKLDSLMGWLHNYRKRIDTALDDGTLKATSRDDVLSVFVDIVSFINKEHRLSLKEDASADPFLAGIQRAKRVVEDRRDAEIARAVQSEEREKEDEEWSRGDDPQENQSEPTTDEIALSCSHCGDTSPADICAPCDAHRARYGKLPSARALAKRRA